jgi:hypothetical protein
MIVSHDRKDAYPRRKLIEASLIWANSVKHLKAWKLHQHLTRRKAEVELSADLALG